MSTDHKFMSYKDWVKELGMFKHGKFSLGDNMIAIVKQ